MKKIDDLIEEILRSNQEQVTEAQIRASATAPVSDSVARRKLHNLFRSSSVWSGLSRAFNTKSGSPRYSIRTIQVIEKLTPKNKATDNPQTYSWSPVTTMESGLTIPYVYGTMKVKGNVMTGHLGGSNNPDTQQSVAAVIAVSKGPIDSFIYADLNGQHIFDSRDAGSPFSSAPLAQSVTHLAGFDFRLGFNRQAPTSNYGDVYNTFTPPNGADQAVLYGNPVILTVDMTGKDDAWIYLKFPNGLYNQPETSSDLGAESCSVTVDIRKVGTTDWTNVFTGDIAVAKRTAYRYYIRLFESAYGNYYWLLDDVEYEIKVSKLTVDKTLDVNKAVNDLVIEYFTSGVRDDFSYNGIAWVELWGVATETLSGSLDFSTVIKGRQVKVYSDVNTYTLQWSDNPAWCCLDVLTQPIWDNSYAWDGTRWVYSGGSLSRHDGIDPSLIDIQSFIDWADHCDESVTPPDYDPTDVKRCTFNGVFDTATNIWDAAQSIAQNARAWLLPPSGSSKYRVVLDKATAVTQVFTGGSILAGSLRQTYTSMADRATELQIDFVNKDNDWETDTFSVVYEDATTIREDSLNLFGITVPSQAWRRAMLHLYYNALTPLEIQFDVGQDALNCEVGDVIGVQDELPQWGYGGRIVSATASAITLDRDVSFPTPTQALTVRATDDTLYTYTVTTGSAPNIVAGTFSPVPAQYDPYAFGPADTTYKPFRVTEIKNNGDTTFTISGQEYNASIYNVDTDTPPVATSTYSLLEAFPAVTIDDLDEILIKKQDGTIIDCIDVYFTRPESSLFAKADVYFRQKASSGDSYPTIWSHVGVTNKDKIRITDVLVNRYYEVAVVTINTAGRRGAIDLAPSEELYTIGKADPPSNVTGFAASQTGSILVFTWNHIEDADLWGYEIRQGLDYATSLQIINIQSANRYDFPAPHDGTFRFWIRAIDTSGNYSATPASADITVTGIEDSLNFVVDEDVVATYDDSGQLKYNYTWASGDLKFTWSVSSGSTGEPGYWEQFTTNKDFLAVYESDDIEVASSAVDTTVRLSHDLEATIENATDLTFPDRTDQTYPTDTDLHITTTAASYLYYAFGASTPATGNFTQYLTPIQESIRYLRARSIVVADNYDTAVELTHLRVMADMQDIEFEISDFSITNATGAVIEYSTYYTSRALLTETPKIFATVTYGALEANPVSVVPYISRVNSKFFQIELKDIVGSGRTGKVNIRVHAY